MQIPTQRRTTLTDVFMVFVSPFRQMPGLCHTLDHDSFHLIAIQLFKMFPAFYRT